MIEDRVIAKNFHLSEILASETATRKGIDNTPPERVMANILDVLAPGLQRIRDFLSDTLGRDVGIILSSGYRSALLNKTIGGSSGSQHIQGLAADFIAPRGGSVLEIFELLANAADELDFDQLIMEGNWIHISFSPGPRGQILVADFSQPGVTYVPWEAAA